MSKRKSGGFQSGGGGESGGDSNRWLLTYSDMISLMLALFIFLYSISSVNGAKLVAAASVFAELFGLGKVPESSASQSGGSGILPEANAIVELQKQLEANLSDLIEDSLAEVEVQEEGLTLRLKDKVVFALGQAQISPRAEPVLWSIARLLSKLPNPLRIEGHTDNLPMAPGSAYPSNWELSGARAASVARFLIDKAGINPSRLSVAGYAEFRPIAPNAPLVGNAQNRRVEIVVVKKKDKVVPNVSLVQPPEVDAQGPDQNSQQMSGQNKESSTSQHSIGYLETDL